MGRIIRLKLTLNHPLPSNPDRGRGSVEWSIESNREIVISLPDIYRGSDQSRGADGGWTDQPFFPACPPNPPKVTGSICLSFEAAKSSRATGTGRSIEVMDVYPSRDNVRCRVSPVCCRPPRSSPPSPRRLSRHLLPERAGVLVLLASRRKKTLPAEEKGTGAPRGTRGGGDGDPRDAGTRMGESRGQLPAGEL